MKLYLEMDYQMDECLFCKIVNNEVPCELVFENEYLLAFRDINPQAPTHILVIPRKHISTINELETEDAGLVGEILLTAKNLAKVENIDQDGFRTVFNCNKDGGQTVFHIHLHLLGGRRFSWPPG